MRTLAGTELFQPCVLADLIAPSALAGYRSDTVYLRTSRFVPPRWEAVRDAMPASSICWNTKPNRRTRRSRPQAVRLCPPVSRRRRAHGTFLMNAMLASGDIPFQEADKGITASEVGCKC
jgi:hypothetical protein